MNLIKWGLVLASIALSLNAWSAELKTEQQKLGYIIGMDIGKSLREQASDVDLDALMEAIQTTFHGEKPRLTPEEAAAVRKAYIEKRKQEQAAEKAKVGAKNLAEGQKFLAENKTKPGVKTTASGLQYQVIKMGEGPKPKSTDTVKVNYRGTLLNGTEFDSSYARKEPISFALDRVIPGWTEGLQLMPVGSKFKFFVKPELAYGENGGGPIPPNATLIFDVELLGIEDAKDGAKEGAKEGAK